MRIETLKRDNKKKWIIGSIVVMALIVTITYIGTRAEFKSTAHASIARGVINYNYDLDIVAVNIQNDSGEYESSADVPTSGYTLSKEKSFCKVGNEIVNVSMEYNGKVYISTNKKGTKCELYFDKGEFKTKDLILSQNTIDHSRASGSFSSPFQEDTSGRIFNSIDDDGETFFFAGTNPNNWVKFGTNKEGQELYWRIIRINGDESIRIIYNGPTTDQTGETTQIVTSAFNENQDDNAYVGYMYGTPGSSTYAETHANINSSTIKTYIDTWYEGNLKKNYGLYLDENAGFCGDRGIHSGSGTSAIETHYAPFNRTWNTHSSTYKCVNQANDLYTLKESVKGNKVLDNPIGLMTIDEAMYAGGYGGLINKSYWLYTNKIYWTMSTCYFISGNERVHGIASNGSLFGELVDRKSGIRPVINLKADTLKIGSGTTTDPYRML